MSTWLLWSIIVSVVLLLVVFLLVFNSRRKFELVQRIMGSVRCEKGVTVQQFWCNRVETEGLEDIQIYHDKQYSYYPKQRVITMEQDKFYSDKLFDVTAVAHEMGHAIMHQKGSRMMALWYSLVHFEKWVCWAIMPLWLCGIIMICFWGVVADLGTTFLNLSTLFTAGILFGRIVNIPTEKQASDQAMRMLEQTKLFSPNELKMAKKMLSVALSTYIVAFYERLFYNIIVVNKMVRRVVKRAPKKGVTTLSCKSNQEGVETTGEQNSKPAAEHITVDDNGLPIIKLPPE